MGFDASRVEKRSKKAFFDAASGPAPIRHAVMIGNFPPRKCGIATFTRDAFNSLRERLPDARVSLVAMDDGKAKYRFPAAVTHVIPQDDAEAYERVADELNASGAEVAFLQHEFGIYGGEAGAHVLKLMRRLRMPVIVTLHTVLENPSPAQKRVMDEILDRAAAGIVMTEMGADILSRVHGVGPSKMQVIPHGAPERPFASPETFKAPLGLWGRKVLMTFGLLSPNKGLETIIRALPGILSRHPDALYVVVGATHPHLKASEGEAYRDSLVELAASLGVKDNLRFVNRFVGDAELVDLLQAADIYVTPYLTEAQITSGTLTYAIALGKPVVSTPYWHAKEALADGVGVLCGFNDSAAFAREITRLLSDRTAREAMARRAYKAGEPSRWPKVAAASADLALACRETYRRKEEETFRALACPSSAAVIRMTDDCGMMQHACFSVPDRRHGYCTDDNARVLSLMARLLGDGDASAATEKLAYASAAFVNHAWNPETGRFRNFMGFNRQWLDEGGSDDCCARALEALCLTARHAGRPDLRDWAIGLARDALKYLHEWKSIRAHALVIKALLAGEGLVTTSVETGWLLSKHSRPLLTALQAGRSEGHGWFEPAMSYDNARLPEALILASRYLNDSAMLSAGLAALEHVMDRQTSQQGLFCPVATSSFDSGADHPQFDQQPIETLATVDACLAAWRATGDPRHAAAAETVFRWFGGDNVHGIALASPADGGCRDGLTADGVNRNQGAESILAYHLAAAAMRDLLRQRGRSP